MEWISENWFFLLFAVIFIGMHFFGFGCGGHRRHGKHAEQESDEHKKQARAGSSDSSPAKKGHSCCN
jgi:hypothetical protein